MNHAMIFGGSWLHVEGNTPEACLTKLEQERPHLGKLTYRPADGTIYAGTHEPIGVIYQNPLQSGVRLHGSIHRGQPMNCFLSYLADGSQVYVPEVRITHDQPEYVYHPLRGYSSLLAVFDIQDKCIGWIDTRTLGYANAKEWMEKTRYIQPKRKDST